MRCENPETQLSAGLALEDPYLCMPGKNKAVFEVWIKWEFNGLHVLRENCWLSQEHIDSCVMLHWSFTHQKCLAAWKLCVKPFNMTIHFKWITQNIVFFFPIKKKVEVGNSSIGEWDSRVELDILCSLGEKKRTNMAKLLVYESICFKPSMSCANKDWFSYSRPLFSKKTRNCLLTVYKWILALLHFHLSKWPYLASNKVLTDKLYYRDLSSLKYHKISACPSHTVLHTCNMAAFTKGRHIYK